MVCRHGLMLFLLGAVGCAAPTQDAGSTASSSSGSATSGAAGATSSNSGSSANGSGANGSSTNGSSANGSSASMGTASSAVVLPVGEWTDAPGTCPDGMQAIPLATVSELEDASRGEGAHANDPAASCYLIQDGVYVQAGATLPLYITVGGASAASRRVFVGQSRAGVIIQGRAAVADGVSHVTLGNLTLDLTGYAQAGSFNTLTLGDGQDILVDHTTFTGDCATGSTGGHIETNNSQDVTKTACLIEKFGHCGPNGHLDHGVYLASGARIALINNVIRDNASRGVQLFTNGGDYGTLDTVLLSRNRIHGNGHANYEDGVAINGSGTGTISNVTVEHNIIHGNYYSGLRFVDTALAAIHVSHNTFFHNGTGSTASNRSEINLDDVGSGANTRVERNILVAANRVLNDCQDAAPRAFLLVDNITQGMVPTGVAGNCIQASVDVDPQLAAPETGDFHALSPQASGYGALSP